MAVATCPPSADIDLGPAEGQAQAWSTLLKKGRHMLVTKATVLGKLCAMARAINVQGVGGEVLEADFLGEGELSVGLWTPRMGIEVVRVGGHEILLHAGP